MLGSLALMSGLPATANAVDAPPGRGYELVSPADKNGAPVQNVLRMAADGQGMAWLSLGGYADVRGSNTQVAYAARRTADGWTTRAFFPRFTGSNRPDLLTGLGAFAFPDDLSSMLFVSQGAFTPDDRDNYPLSSFGPVDTYRVDDAGNSTLISHDEGGAGANGFMSADISGYSGDGETVFFRTADGLTLDAPAGFNALLYRNVGGHVTLVGRAPDGRPLEGGSWLAQGVTYTPAGTADAGELPDSVGVNHDGSVFVYGGRPVDGDPRQVYLQVGDAAPVQVSLSQRSGTVGDPSTSDSIFLVATPDFRKLFIQSADQLTDDAPVGGGDYLYDVASGDLSFVVPDTSLTSDASSIGVSGLVQISDDGTIVYHVSTQALAAGATAGRRNLFVTSGGTTTFVATLADTDSDVATTPQDVAQAFSPRFSRSSATPDGKQLVFETSASLEGAPTNGYSALYEYDFDTRAVTCISCRPDGGPSEGDATTRVTDNDTRLPTPNIISDDGSTIVFTSDDQLLPTDTNDLADVYERRDGTLYLVSGGTSRIASTLAGVSQDASDIYFRTAESLVARDVDHGLRDIYDARRGGGEPQYLHDTPPCAGDQCQAPPTPQGAQETPGSTLVDGSDESQFPDPVPTPRLSLSTFSKAQLRTLGRSGKLTVKARVTVAGRVTAALRAKIGKRQIRVASASRTARSAGTVSIRLTLSKAARRALARNGKLKVGLSVSYSKVAGQQSRSFTIHAARRTTRRGSKR